MSVQALTRELGRSWGSRQTGAASPACVGASASGEGMQRGEISTARDGDAIQATQPSEAELFATMIRQYKIGSTVKLSTIRDKDERQVTLTLEASPRLPREMKKYEDPNFDFRVRDIASADRPEAGLSEGQAGVLVEAVREGGWAALGHLADGDVILAIDGEAMPDSAAVQKKLEAIAAGKPQSVVLKVKRGIRTFFVELQTGWK